MVHIGNIVEVGSTLRIASHSSFWAHTPHPAELFPFWQQLSNQAPPDPTIPGAVYGVLLTCTASPFWYNEYQKGLGLAYNQSTLTHEAAPFYLPDSCENIMWQDRYACHQ